jgi:fumarylacetoacetase
MIDKNLKSWIPVKADSDFPIQNIPFGIAQIEEGYPHVVTRIGDEIIDLSCLCGHGFFSAIPKLDMDTLTQPVLNDFIGMGKEVTRKVRQRLAELFSLDNAEIRDDEQIRACALWDIAEVTMLMPLKVGDYTDFYSSIEHATNVGKMFRDPANALLPNWRHLPVGYHGRSSSIVVSGTSIHRPKGQTVEDETKGPVFGPSKQLDFELETAFVTCGSTKLGDSIRVEQAEDYIFGMVLFNDLSARDIQRWEYVPLGPFLSKSFGSVISPWVVTLEALEPFRTEGPVQSPSVLPYLQSKGRRNLDLNLEVYIQPKGGAETLICRTNHRFLYWNMAQQLAHQTVAGCNINVGDLYASGTISGPTEDALGSLLELTWKGTKPIKLSDGTERRFLEDGDTVIIRGFSAAGDLRIGFGECRTTILGARG